MLFVSIPLCEVVRRNIANSNSIEPLQKLGYAFLIFCFFGWSIVAFKVNAIAILIAVFIIIIGIDLRFGRKVFSSQMPSYLIAILGCPSVSFWSDYYFYTGMGFPNYVFFKFIFVFGFFLIWICVALLKGTYPRIINMILYCLICMAFLFNRVQNSSLPSGDNLYINDNMLADNSQSWLGSDLDLTNDEKRFLIGYDKISKRVYYSDTKILNVLNLKVSNVASVHPIAICLKSAGLTINSSRQIELDVGENVLQVNEIEITTSAGKSIAYSWFSNNSISTGDFNKFRFSKFVPEGWMHYQIIIGNTDGSSITKQVARETLVEFLKAFSNKSTI